MRSLALSLALSTALTLVGLACLAGGMALPGYVFLVAAGLGFAADLVIIAKAFWRRARSERG